MSTRTQTRQTQTPGDPLPDIFWTITADTGPIPGPAPQPAPLPVKAISASASDTGYPASNAIDGNLSTGWRADGPGNWIQLDLGQLCNITEIDISFYKGNARTNNFAIDISADAKSFKNVFTGVSSGTNVTDVYTFQDLGARLIKITVNGNNDPKPANRNYAHIQEIVAKGEPAPPAPTPTGAQAIVARPSQTAQPGQTVTLDGSQSKGDLIAYQWAQTSGTAVTILNATMAIASFVAPSPPSTTGSVSLGFSLTVTDKGKSTSTANAIVVVQNTPPPPVDVVTANAVSASTAENTAVNITPSVTLSDPTKQVASYTLGKPTNGTASVLVSGRFVYAPNTGFSGTDSFTYTATDNSTPPVTSNVATVTITVTAVTPPPSNVDKFGISKIYADAPGPVTYINMNNPSQTTGASPGNNPEGNSQYYPNFVVNSDGSWKNTNGKEVRWAWTSPGDNGGQYPGDSNICKCYDTDNKNGFMSGPGDWKPAIEMTGYFRSPPGSTTTNTQNGETHFEFVISGHRSTTSSSSSGPGGCQLGCAGSYHGNFYPLTGRQKWEKDYHHSFAYAQDISGVNNNSATPKWADDNLWHGFKCVFYILPDGRTVQLEHWTDFNNTNTWKKTHSFQDDGIKWTPKQSYTGCGNGPQTIQFLFNGPLIDFRADNWNNYDLKNLSARTIDPTKPLMGAEHDKVIKATSKPTKTDEIYQARGVPE